MIKIENNLQSGLLDLVLEGEEKSQKQITDDMKMFLVGALLRVNNNNHDDLFQMIATRYFISSQASFDELCLLGDECLVLLGLYKKQKHHCDIRVANDVGPMVYAACSGKGGGQLYAQASASFGVLTQVLSSIQKPVLRLI